jgi:tight adherence protein C
MSSSPFAMLIDLAVLLVFFSALALWWFRRSGQRYRIAERARRVAQDHYKHGLARAAGQENSDLHKRLVAQLATIGDKIPLFDAKYRLKLQKDMVRSGYRSNRAVSVLLAFKFCIGLLCAALTIMFGSNIGMIAAYPMVRAAAVLAAFVVGMIIPEYVVAFRASKRRKVISSSLPDALDLLVICTNAGNSLAVSIRRVAHELKTICAPLAEEFSLTADELNLSGDSTRALHGLGERIDLPSIRALISTLIQSMRYGTPISQALRILSRTERLAHMMSLEEKAAKLAPKMVVPMMLFILPAIVAIAAGPAVIQLLAYIAAQ